MTDVHVNERKRPRNPGDWAREKRKQARISGKEYVNARGELVQARTIGSDCGCRRKCYGKVPSSVRSALFHAFYDLGSYDAQNVYLSKMIRKDTPARCRAKDPAKARGHCYQYFVRVHGLDVQICREAFTSIHAISPHRIRSLCRKLEKSNASLRDERGRHDNRRKTPVEIVNLIRSHIQSLLESGTLRLFLKDDLKRKAGRKPGEQKASSLMNISKMWKNFLELSDPHYSRYVIVKKSQIRLKDGEGSKENGLEEEEGKDAGKRAPIEPLAKHWIYSKVFHDEFEDQVAAVLENGCEQSFDSETSDDRQESSSGPPASSEQTPLVEPHVEGNLQQDGSFLVVQEYQETSPQLAASDQVHVTYPHPQFVQPPSPSVILPAKVQGLGDVNLLVQSDGQARILPANQVATDFQAPMVQRPLVMVPVTISMTISSCVPGLIVTGATDVAGCAAISPALGTCHAFTG